MRRRPLKQKGHNQTKRMRIIRTLLRATLRGHALSHWGNVYREFFLSVDFEGEVHLLLIVCSDSACSSVDSFACKIEILTEMARILCYDFWGNYVVAPFCSVRNELSR